MDLSGALLLFVKMLKYVNGHKISYKRSVCTGRGIPFFGDNRSHPPARSGCGSELQGAFLHHAGGCLLLNRRTQSHLDRHERCDGNWLRDGQPARCRLSQHPINHF